jgi:hypothetical protein
LLQPELRKPKENGEGKNPLGLIWPHIGSNGEARP